MDEPQKQCCVKEARHECILHDFISTKCVENTVNGDRRPTGGCQCLEVGAGINC